MREFAGLYAAIDETNKTNEKVSAMAHYFSAAPAEDAAWTIHFLIGRRPKRLVKGPKLWEWAIEASGLPAWLFAECYDAVGDIAETMAAVLPDNHPAELPPFEGRVGEGCLDASQLRLNGPTPDRILDPQSEIRNPQSLSTWVKDRLLPLGQMDEPDQQSALLAAWSELDRQGRYVFIKLITGEFRVGVSQDLVVRALSQMSGLPAPVIAHRLMGSWEPSGEFFDGLIASDSADADVSRPYPFCLAHPIDREPAKLGDIENWHAEWKWDGIRAQLIRRGGESFIWSRGEDLITERFPEIAAFCDSLPDGTVIDGEIMAWKDGRPMKFLDLQQRIGRKVLSPKILERIPAVVVAFDVLEWAGEDMRRRPLVERRVLLDSLDSTSGAALLLSPEVKASTWDDLATIREKARARGVEGLMLKRKDSAYEVGRKKGPWWKWKLDPMTVDCVLIYAQKGTGRRASLYTDYSFGVWNGDQLVTLAKAYSGLSDEEIRRVDNWVRHNTTERSGPVRVVKPELVFELGFEAIQLSSRHKSGVAVRFPRILRWRRDKGPRDADTLESVKEMLSGQ